MFELSVLRRTGNGEDVIDIGLLAETLLFYQRVHLLLDSGTLTYLVTKIGPDLLLELLDRPGISASFIRDSLGTITNNNGGLTSHTFAQFFVGPAGRPRFTTAGYKFKWSARWDKAAQPRSLQRS
jgi:hypothetical protein